MVAAEAGKPKAKPKERILVDERLRDLIMKLVQSRENKRIHVVNEIMGELHAKQDSVQSGICMEVTYTVTRLVRGVASEKARLSFSLLLTQMLRSFPDLSIEFVQEKVKTLLQVQKMDTKGEQGNAALGQVMVHLCLIQAGRLQQATGKEIKLMTSELERLRQVRKPLNLMCTEALRHLITQVPCKRFSKWVWPVLEPVLSGGWQNCTAEILLLLLAACRHQSETVKNSTVMEHWNSKIISKQNMKSIAKVVKSITHQSNLHPTCIELLQSIVSKPKTLAIFWKRVVDGSLLMSHSTPEMKFLVFQMVPHALSLCSTPEQIRVVLSSRVSACFMGSLCDNHSMTRPAADVMASHLVKFVSSCSEASHQMAVLEALLSMPAESKIDHRKNRMFLSLISSMNADGVKAFCKLLINIILNQLEGWQSSSLQNIPVRWAAQTLCNMVSLPVLTSHHQYQTEVLHFIFCYAFFIQSRPSPDVPHCAVRRILTELERVTFTNGFFCVLGKLARFNADESTSRNPEQYINILDQLIQYAEVLLANNSVVTPVKEFSQKKQGEWKKIIKVNKEMKQMGKDTRKAYAFRLLFLHFGLHLFMKGFSSDMLQDLHTCYLKAFEKKQGEAQSTEEDEPEWMHVLMELLLSILSENKNWVRTFVSIVFRMICRHVTTSSVQSIIDVLGDDKNEDGPLDFDDDEEEDNDDDNGEDNEDHSSEADAEAENKEEDESEDDDSMDEGLRTDVAKALGNAAHNSDEEGSSDLSDLSDSEMSKFDNALAAVFRNSGSAKKKQAEEKERALQLKNFKLKCLDLVSILIQSQANVDVLLQLVRPLLELVDKSFKDKSMKVLGERAKNTLFMLCNRKKFSTEVTMSKDELLILVKDLFCFTTKAPILKAIGNACLFVMRLLVGSGCQSQTLELANNSSKTEQKPNQLQKLLDFMRESIEECCEKSPTSKDLSLFVYVISRQPTLMWPLTDSLLQHLKNDQIRLYRRTQVCTMLVDIINKNTIQEIGHSAWLLFAKRLVPEVYQVLQTFCSTALKPRMVRLLLSLLYKALTASNTEDATDLIPSGLYKCAESVKANTSQCKDTKRTCNDLTRFITARLGADRLAAEKELEVDSEQVSPTNKKKRKCTDDSDDNDDDVMTPAKQKKGTPSSSSKKKKRLSAAGDVCASDITDTAITSPTKKKKKCDNASVEDKSSDNAVLTKSRKQSTPKSKTPDTVGNSSKKRKRHSLPDDEAEM